MKKRFITFAFAVLVAAIIVSCQKEERLGINSTQQQEETDLTDDIGIDLRADQYTIAYQKTLEIIDSIGCSFDYDLNNMYSFGTCSAGYVFCVPTVYPDYYVIIFPSLSCAFALRNVEQLPNYNTFTLRPPYYYDFEVLDACFSEVLFEGELYPNSNNPLFVVTAVDLTNINTLDYNLNTLFSNVAVGSYTYQGVCQAQYYMLSLDEYLFSIAKQCLLF